ncbi:MAG: urease subunit beta [Lachnospiraceae bacterium]
MRPLYGYHLDIPSGTSVRFEPGKKRCAATEMGGRKTRIWSE